MVVLCLSVSTTRWDSCTVSECTVQQGGMVVLCLGVQFNKLGWLYCVCTVSECTVQQDGIFVLSLSVLYNKVG